jgi:hypothetical protein
MFINAKDVCVYEMLYYYHRFFFILNYFVILEVLNFSCTKLQVHSAVNIAYHLLCLTFPFLIATVETCASY